MNIMLIRNDFVVILDLYNLFFKIIINNSLVPIIDLIISLINRLILEIEFDFV